MKKIFLFLSISALVSCGSSEKQVQPHAQPVNYFGSMNGCFLLFNVKTNQFEKVIGEQRCREQLPACSTFKVPLAAMAFDSGVLKDENTVFKWNGKKDIREESNRDHNAKTWMRDSIVWYSQRITPKMGKKKFQNYLDQFNYGNKDLNGGITQAWLVSPASSGPALKISGYEQIDFMKKLWTNQLPVSPRSMQLTRDITFIETSPNGFQLHGKTGSNFYDKERKIHLGWFISHLQKGDQEYIVVTNLSDLGPTEAKGYGGMRARELTKKILADNSLW